MADNSCICVDRTKPYKVSRNYWKLDKQVAAQGAAKMVLATPASEAICERLFKRAKHIGTTDRMARMLDESFEMLVMAQYNIARHGGVEAIEVSMHF